MPRLPNDIEGQREQIEATQGYLAKSQVMLHLVTDRVRAALHINGNEGLLAPTVEDCQIAQAFIRQAQISISENWQPQPVNGGRLINSESSSEETHKIHATGSRGRGVEKTGASAPVPASMRKKSGSHNVPIM